MHVNRKKSSNQIGLNDEKNENNLNRQNNIEKTELSLNDVICTCRVVRSFQIVRTFQVPVLLCRYDNYHAVQTVSFN